MAVRQYIGARYVTKIYENSVDPASAEWEPSTAYEPLTMVTYNNSSYLSKKEVPNVIGDPANNPTYWVETGFYNGQIAALQNQINQILETIAGDFADSDFKAMHLGSADSRGAQCFVKHSNLYYACYEDDNDGYIKIDKINATTFIVDSTEVLSVQGHPNACILYNDNLYIVDTDSRDIYVVDVSTWNVIDTITTYEPYLISSINIDENGKIYLLGRNDNNISVFVLTDDLQNIDHIIDLDYNSIERSSFVVQQGLFVYNSIIYIVCNRPNTLICFTMDGKPIGVKFMGEGNGFYPYGEVEFFTISGNDILMTGSPYQTIESEICAYFQVFKTNINKVLTGEDIYGQNFPSFAELNIDNTLPHTPNAVGSTTNPFDIMFEACCVYMYNYDRNRAFTSIKINGNFASDKAALTNCVVSFKPQIGGTNCGTWRFKNAVIKASKCNFTKLTMDGGSLEAYRSKFADVVMGYCNGSFEESDITNLLQLTSAVIFDGGLGTPTTYTELDSEIKRTSKIVNKALLTSETAFNLGVIPKALLRDNTVSSINLTITLSINSVVNATNTVIYLGSGAKTSLSGGTPFVRELVLNCYDGSDVCFVHVTFKVDTDYDIKMTKISAVKLDGTAVSISTTSVNVGMVSIEQHTI